MSAKGQRLQERVHGTRLEEPVSGEAGGAGWVGIAERTMLSRLHAQAIRA